MTLLKSSFWEYIKRRVDVFIFPFIDKEDDKVYSLHILVNRNGKHRYEYFESTFMGTKEEDINKYLLKKKLMTKSNFE